MHRFVGVLFLIWIATVSPHWIEGEVPSDWAIRIAQGMVP